MKTETARDLCVICGKIEINGYWYRALKVPPHEPSYKGAICPECKKKKEERTKQKAQSGNDIAAS